MLTFILRRIGAALFVIWAVVTIVFLAMRLVPADPAQVVLGDYATAESLAAFRRDAGLDQSLYVQYGQLIVSLLHGDLGRSLISNQAIGPMMASAFPHTLSLAVGALLVGALIGIPAGVLAAVHPGSWMDFLGRIVSLVGLSFPAFFIGIVLLIVFSGWLGWFPVVHSLRTNSLSEALYKLVLPSFSLGLVQAAYLTRLTRSTMLEALNQDYVRTGFAKGLKPSKVYYKHALRNVLIPIVTAMGLYAGTVLGGAILTETVFNRPGLGKLLVGAVAQRDYNLIQSGLILFSAVVIAVNLLVDLSYGFLDPRITNG